MCNQGNLNNITSCTIRATELELNLERIDSFITHKLSDKLQVLAIYQIVLKESGIVLDRMFILDTVRIGSLIENTYPEQRRSSSMPNFSCNNCFSNLSICNWYQGCGYENLI